jgi:hypothetical protein
LDRFYKSYDERVLSDVSYTGALVVECGVDLAGLLGDETGVRFTVRLPSEVYDLEISDIGNAAPDSRDDIFFNEALDGATTLPWNASE